MDYHTVNLDAAEDALRLIGGAPLVAIGTVLYHAVNAAEERGFEQGYRTGYDIGMIEGRQEIERAFDEVVYGEGGDVAAMQAELTEAKKRVEQAEPQQQPTAQPSDKGFEALAQQQAADKAETLPGQGHNWRDFAAERDLQLTEFHY
jgi:hypothetical protein